MFPGHGFSDDSKRRACVKAKVARFVERPISAVLLLMALGLLVILVLSAVRRKREEVFQE
jgi:putative tricarboxylic transport membrane protein